ncbi:MAG TPA: serine/threonine-protein kinase [Kofleriaceae bacterium]|nr:serine/threonine-protein kinase [Kofleriaceae bacterium]
MYAAQDADPRLGTVLHDRYEIQQRIAAGAMAVVYRGERVRLKRPVAIKFLHESYASSDDGMQRFEREALVMSRLNHPNCVSVTDFGVDNGSPYLVMDFIDGRSLREVLGVEHRMPASRALHIVRQILAGLSHAHGQGVFHRDVKPENILLTTIEGHGEQVRILDFGLAKLRNETSVTTGIAVGTPGYMSPEQTAGERVDERSDIYATGIILYELLSGKKPFQSDSPYDVMRMHREVTPTPLCFAAPDAKVSDELDTVIQRALAKPREARFASASAFLLALEATPEGQARHGRAAAPAGLNLTPAVAVAIGLVVLAVIVILAFL